MKRVAAVGLLTAILTLFTAPPASAERGCVIDVLGIKVCGELLTPLPTVTIKPDPIVVPGPTVTLPPKPPVTITVPGPTETVTIPGPTSTVTAQPNNPGPSQAPTVTVTPEAVPTGQPTPTRGTVTPTPEQPDEPRTNTETRTKTETIVRNVAIGGLVVLALVILGVIA
jgi:hypothetical protein